MIKSLSKMCAGMLILSSVLVGCSKDKDVVTGDLPSNTNNNNNQSSELTDKEREVFYENLYKETGMYQKEYKDVEKKIFDDQYMMEYYGPRLEGARAIFDKYGIKYFDNIGDEFLALDGGSLDNVEGDYAMRYIIDGNLDGGHNKINFEVDIRMTDPENFKFNDSILNDVRTLINPDDEDISRIVDILIRKQFIEGMDCDFYRDKGNIRETILFFEDSIYYTFTLYKEPVGSVEETLNTYEGVDGDKIEITLSSDVGHVISKDTPFIISKNGEDICKGDFMPKEFFEKLPDVAESDSRMKFIETRAVNGINFILYSSADSTTYYVAMDVNDSNTVVHLVDIKTEDDARFLIGSLIPVKVN